MKEGGGGEEGTALSSRSFTCAIFRVVFDSRPSFFAPKPHGNACYPGYTRLRMLDAYVFAITSPRNNKLVPSLL